jgi:hypothetical protein
VPTSDIVALMTMEHQARMTNLINGISQQFRRSSTNMDRAVEQILEYMLFVDEAPLRDPIKAFRHLPRLSRSEVLATTAAGLFATSTFTHVCSGIHSRT